jgi:exodeoxyribonuclease-3
MLEYLAADIAVIQECARPAVESDRALWFGDSPRQGIAVLASPGFRLTALAPLPDVPKFMVPVRVSGQLDFTLFAVWAKRNPTFPYVEGVVRAVQLYRELISGSATVLLGDFNSNRIWDREHPADASHSALVAQLGSMGLVSAYHAFHDEPHGAESLPTHYFRWSEKRPFHIDYCFLPDAWKNRITQVEVGSFDEWQPFSDHRPVIVDIAEA